MRAWDITVDIRVDAETQEDAEQRVEDALYDEFGHDAEIRTAREVLR